MPWPCKVEIAGGAELSWKVQRVMDSLVQQVRDNWQVEKLNGVEEIHVATGGETK